MLNFNACALRLASMVMTVVGLVAAGRAAAQSGLPNSLTNGLIGYYTFAGDAADRSGNGHDGTVIGAALTTDRFGQTNSAYSFNSPFAAIDLGNAPEFEFSNDFTFSFWLQGDRQSQTIYFLGKYTGYEEVGYGIGIGSLGGEPYAFLQETGYPHGAYADGGPALTDNQWHQVVAVFARDSALTVYVDGNPTASTTAILGVQGALTNTNHLLLGRITSGQAFVGSLDDVRIYNRAISSNEVGSLYLYEAPGGTSPPAIAVAPVATVVSHGGSASFGVRALSVTPIAYQWAFNGTNVDGATNAQFTLSNVMKSNAGNYSVSICNSFGCTNTSPVALVVNPGPSVVSLTKVSAKSPGYVTVPIVVNANGDENALTFSLRFDPRLLTFSDAIGVSGAQVLVNSTRATNGVLGFAIAMPAGLSLSEGINEIADVSFSSALLVSPVTTFLQFVDQPVERSVVDASATARPVLWSAGIISIQAADFEGDVYPRPTGDKLLTVSDWVQVGRLVAGLDDVGTGTEFQRADCAPLETGGNGILSVSDWVQAGRFSIGIDPIMPLAGPTNASRAGLGSIRPITKSGPPRTLKLLQTDGLVLGATGVSIALDSDGNENAVGFSVSFDPTKLMFLSAAGGSNVVGATVNINTKHAVDGKIGVALALNTGSVFAKGDVDLAKMRFIRLDAGTNPAPLSFADYPVVREIANPAATAVAGVYQDTQLVNVPTAFTRQTVGTPSGTLAFGWLSELSNAVVEESHVSPSGPWTPVATQPTIVGGVKNLSVLTETGESAVGFYRLRIN